MKDKYCGETYKNAFSRLENHLKDHKYKTQDSIMRRHEAEKHEGMEVNYEMKVLKKFIKDPFSRQCTEGVLIEKIPQEIRINDKLEWNQPGKISVEFKKDGKSKISKFPNVKRTNRVQENEKQKYSQENTNKIKIEIKDNIEEEISVQNNKLEVENRKKVEETNEDKKWIEGARYRRFKKTNQVDCYKQKQIKNGK